MRPILARNLFRLQEHLLGRPSFRILRELRESEWWPRQRLQELKLQRMQHIVQTAYDRTPFWRQFMDEQGIKPADIQTLDDLRKFPLLEKETLREKREDMVWREEGRRIQLVRTSGSTNEALEFYTSSTREAHINAARMRGHEWIGVRRGDKEMYYWASPIELSKQDKVKRVRDWLINDGLTNGFELSPDFIQSNFQCWLKWKPRCLFGYASTFVLTAYLSQRLDLDLTQLAERGLKAIVTTSEVLSDHDRQCISHAFGVPVFDSYGVREAGLIGHECSEQTMHCMEEQMILETIDPMTLEPTDGHGELVVTNLVGPAFPVIRYRTGDMVTLHDGRCSCGRTLTSLEVSGGRIAEYIVTKSGKLISGIVSLYTARAVKGIVKFQLVQDKVEEVIYQIAVDYRFPENGKEEVKDILRKRLGDEVQIEVEIVDDIEPSPSGKYRPVVSKVADQYIGIPR